MTPGLACQIGDRHSDRPVPPAMGLERTNKHVRPSAMVQFDGLHSVRLEVGVLSIGWVVTVLGVALERADHVVLACSVVFRVSRQRAQRRLPETSVASPARVGLQC